MLLSGRSYTCCREEDSERERGKENGVLKQQKHAQQLLFFSIPDVCDRLVSDGQHLHRQS